MSDSPKYRNSQLALLLVPVVPDGTPRLPANALQAPSPAQPLDPDAAVWFDDPDTRYVVH